MAGYLLDRPRVLMCGSGYIVKMPRECDMSVCCESVHMRVNVDELGGCPLLPQTSLPKAAWLRLPSSYLLDEEVDFGC